jgi:hypothetical protein
MSMHDKPRAAASAHNKENTTMIDSLETMKAELRHLVQLLRPHYPEEPDDELYALAMDIRPEAYAKGRSPTDKEIEQRKPAVVAAKKRRAEKAAAAALTARLLAEAEAQAAA